MSWMKKTVPFALAASLAVTAMPNIVDAKGPHHKGPKWEQKWEKKSKKKKFKDVEQHWAQSTIQKMSLLGIIEGYSDFTFKPNKPVTQAEAVVMAVRLLGLEEEAAAKSDVNLSFRNERSIPSWAKGSVAVALDQELLANTHVFQANKPATRLFVMMLLVNAIDAEFDGNWEEATSYFEDVEDLDNTEKIYLAYATLTNLVNGYKDNTFRPNKPVTRAEMAALINRVLHSDELELERKVEGVIESIDEEDDTLTVKSTIDGETEEITYTFSEDVEVSIDGDDADLQDLEDNMNVRLVLKNDQVQLIEATTSEVNEDQYEGTVTKIGDELIWVKVDQVEVPFYLSEDIEIDNLDVGDEITFTLQENGKIASIDYDGKTDEEEGLLIQLGDVEELYVNIDDEEEFQAELTFELTENGYNASAEITKEDSSFDLDGEEALEYIVKLFQEANISLEEDEIDFEEIYEKLVNHYDFTAASIDGSFVVDGVSYAIEEDRFNNEDTEELLEVLADLKSMDLSVTGDNDVEVSIQYHLKEDETFEAAVHVVQEDNHEVMEGKSALEFIVNISENANVDFDTELPVNEITEDWVDYIIDHYDVEDANIDGNVIIGSSVVDLRDLI